MKLYVTKDPQNFKELITLDLDDVIYIETRNRTLVIHTLHDEYYPLQPTLSTYEHQMKQFGFTKLDRTNLVNVDKIKTYDEELSLVFFKQADTNSGKFGTVSNSSKRVVKQIMKEKKSGSDE